MEQFTKHVGGIGLVAKKRLCRTMAGRIRLDALYLSRLVVQRLGLTLIVLVPIYDLGSLTTSIFKSDKTNSACSFLTCPTLSFSFLRSRHPQNLRTNAMCSQSLSVIGSL